MAATLREREYLRRQVRALSAEGRLSAYILGGLPPGFLLYLPLTKPDYVHAAVHDADRLDPAASAWPSCSVVGVFWMTKVVKVEV